MIKEIRIQNFKSVRDLKLKPGRVTVLIGENGSGKSNILEAVAYMAAASENKLDDEFLYNRGIRVTDSRWMTSAFPTSKQDQQEVRIAVAGDEGEPIEICIRPRGGIDKSATRSEAAGALEISKSVGLLDRSRESEILAQIDDHEARELVKESLNRKRIQESATRLGISEFMVYSPENSVLRNPPPEGAVQPLGTKGEGLFRLLQSFKDPKYSDRLKDLKTGLSLFGWFQDFKLPDSSATADATLQICDRWLNEEKPLFFDQRSANEGFLFALFYLTLVTSWRTPRFFALDNLDTALNPKLCAALMRQLCELSKKYNKQIICTTHNPAILDGLNLADDEQRLVVVRRDSDGHTVVNRVRSPKPLPGEQEMKLSMAFLSGYLGGLPENF